MRTRKRDEILDDAKRATEVAWKDRQTSRTIKGLFVILVFDLACYFIFGPDSKTYAVLGAIFWFYLVVAVVCFIGGQVITYRRNPKKDKQRLLKTCQLQLTEMAEEKTALQAKIAEEEVSINELSAAKDRLDVVSDEYFLLGTIIKELQK